MEGYRREQNITGELLAAISCALVRKPTERLGQLLINVTRGEDLFNIHDEDLASRLYAYLEDRGATPS